ncbi:MAG TPA: hypothetical protein VEQ63_01875 [Bryobacteraceae bacterium]|nr:hypothetical protein [Bryobacteraceae bacterium]
MKCIRRYLRPVLLLAILFPSAYVAWDHRDMPNLAKWHDDAVYFLTGKALAEGQGYRIISLPHEPYQTKYPPLYPSFLSLVWRVNPSFPANLPLATLSSWLAVPFLLTAFWSYTKQLGFSARDCWIFCSLLGWNAYLAMFGISLLSEVWFTVLLLS